MQVYVKYSLINYMYLFIINLQINFVYVIATVVICNCHGLL